MNQSIAEQFMFRPIEPQEGEIVAAIEQICFPPNEACSRERMLQRAERMPEMFLVAEDRKTGEIVGFLNGLPTNETVFRDEFFTDISLYDPSSTQVMILGVDVLPPYRRRGLARAMVAEYCRRQKAAGRKRMLLTCLDFRVPMYEQFGFTDLGISGSVWGGEEWHDMEKFL